MAVSLEGALGSEDADGPKWVHIANEGNYQGYLGGAKPFSFTRKDFEDMVSNTRSHPSFKASATGEGTANVIPWDYNHASEQPANTGDLPIVGAPAQAWTVDLKVETGKNGKAELWALTNFLEPARGYVRAGAYQWASVAVGFNAKHPVTNVNIGAVITSIALTNTPFIEGMEPLVASKAGQVEGTVESTQLVRSFYEPAKNDGKAASMMKELFGLPEMSDLSQLLGDIGKLGLNISNGVGMSDVDDEALLDGIKSILNLELMPALEIAEKGAQVIHRLLAEQDANNSSVLEGNRSSDIPGLLSNNNGENPMLKILASLLGVIESEDAVKAAIEDCVALRTGLIDLFDIEGAVTSGVLLKSAKAEAGARTKLQGLAKALGIKDSEKAVEKVAELMANAASLTELMPELEGLRAEAKKTEEKTVESDVKEAMASHNLPDSCREAILLYRKTDATAFATKYPKVEVAPAAGAQANAHLLSSVAAAPGGTELKVQGAQVVHAAAGTQAPQVASPLAANTVNLANFIGANPTARAQAYLAANMPNWATMSNEDRFVMACSFRKQPHVIDQPAN